MSYNTILSEINNGVLKITLNRPEKYNAITNELWNEFRDVLEKAKENGDVRAVIITGAGKAFCAGGDVDGLKAGFGGHLGFYKKLELTTNWSIRTLAEFPKPVICALNGVAAGGGVGIALASDLIFASVKGKMSIVFTNIGLTLDSGSSFYLPRRVGLAKAKELMYTHRSVGAEEALEMGLVDRVYPLDTFMEEVTAFAEELAQGPTLAYGFGKKLLNESFDNDLSTMLDHEKYLQSVCAESDDYHEGIAAFLDKRDHVYHGK